MISNLGIVDAKKIITAAKDVFRIDLSDYTLTTLKRRFSHIMSCFGASSADDLDGLIRKGSISKDAFVEELMVDETELFRDPSLWREMRERYIPDLVKHPGPKIYIAATSSGDELYSLSIILSEMGLKDKVSIVASCPSATRLKKIREGMLYDAKKMEIGEANYQRYGGISKISNYYTMDGSGFRMNSSLLSNVEFDTNLISQDSMDKSYRMIFLRNWLIQYNIPLYEKVVNSLHQSLVIGGLLFLGNMETLEFSEFDRKFHLENRDERIYRKRVE